MANGVMATLYPDVTPDSSENPSEGDILWGDVNVDGTVDIADVVAAAAFVGDSTKNPVSAQGLKNGDVQNNGDGLTANDALAIQQYLAGSITELPVK